MESETTTQESPMWEKPGKEHDWLQKLVGEWTFESNMDGDGDGQDVFRGTESVRPLGALWVLCEGRGDSSETQVQDSLMTLGFDPRRGRFVGTFVSSMMTHHWVYDGAFSADGKSLVLDCEGPSMLDGAAPGRMVKYQDIIEWVDDDHRLLRAQIQGDDGQWQQFMRSDYRRVK